MQYRHNMEGGKIERIWDVNPYPENGVIYMVFTDMVALALAMADPEDTNRSYKTAAEVPIVWHFSNTTIRNQGRWMEQIIMET